jgi:hypothetical protein
VIAIFRNRSSAQIGDVMDEQAREIFQRAFAAIQRVNCIEHDMREREQHRLLTGDPDEWKVTAETVGRSAPEVIHKVNHNARVVPPPVVDESQPEIFDAAQVATLGLTISTLRGEINHRCDDAIGTLRGDIEKRLGLIERQLADLQRTSTPGLQAELPKGEHMMRDIDLDEAAIGNADVANAVLRGLVSTIIISPRTALAIAMLEFANELDADVVAAARRH